MSKTKKSGFKSFLLALFLFVTLGLDIWAGYITFFGKEQINSNTFILSEMQVKRADAYTGEIITEKQIFCEVEKYDNAMEIKFNYLLDESQTYFYHSGIQIIFGDKQSDKNILDWLAGYPGYDYTKEYNEEQITDRQKTDSDWFSDSIYSDYYLSEYNHIVGNKEYSNANIYYYQSFDNFEYTTINTKKLLNEDNPFFKIQFQEGEEVKVYGLTFKLYDTKLNEYQEEVVDYSDLELISEGKPKYESSGGFWIFYDKEYYRADNYYRAYDLSYFIDQIILNISGQEEGFNGTTYMAMGDMFRYYKCIDEENGKYEEIDRTDNEAAKVSNQFKNYYLTRINIHEGELKSAEQSMFNSYKGNRSYRDSDDVPQTDYYLGRSIIEVNAFDFDWISIDGINYRFTLSEAFIEKYKKVSKKELNIAIDLDFLNKNNINFSGFVSGTFNDFQVHKCVTTQTINGEVVERWVSYV